MTPFGPRDNPDWTGEERRKANIDADKRWLEARALITIIAVLNFIAIGWAWQNGKSETHDTHRAFIALCLLQGDLEKRLNTSKDFLASHPNGAFGFSRGVILKSINDTQQTVKAFRVLKCKEG